MRSVQAAIIFLNGSKMWITNGPVADVVVVYGAYGKITEDSHGITAFIVEKILRIFLGTEDGQTRMRGSDTSELVSKIVMCRQKISSEKLHHARTCSDERTGL